MDGMLVISLKATNHIKYLKEAFTILEEYNMKLKPAKCSFGVSSGQFLGYLITRQGIEANPTQLEGVIKIPVPKNKKDIKRFTRRIAALNRFLPRSSEYLKPLFKLLQKNVTFKWTSTCEEALRRVQNHLCNEPVLTKPKLGEALLLYLAVSDGVVSAVLAKEDG